MKDYADKTWLNASAREELDRQRKLREARNKVGGRFGFEVNGSYTNAEQTDISKLFRRVVASRITFEPEAA